jgi:ribosomal protein S18 acetylase RimI-like enzyme
VTGSAVRIRRLRSSDHAEVVRIDARQTGARKPQYWRRTLRELGSRAEGVTRVGLAARAGARLAGYLIGEVRAFEFGSEPCGWIVTLAVDPAHARTGVASALLHRACEAFASAGVASVRTMVRRNDVPVLAFFRSNGFAAGAYVQLELDLAEAPALVQPAGAAGAEVVT